MKGSSGTTFSGSFRRRSKRRSLEPGGWSSKLLARLDVHTLRALRLVSKSWADTVLTLFTKLGPLWFPDDTKLAQKLTCHRHLRVIELHSCARLTNAALAPLAGLTGLESLSLSQAYNIDHNGLRHLSRATGLSHLCLRSAHSLQQASLGHLSNLQSLDLEGCTALRRLGLGAGLPKLRRLDVSSCTGIQVQALETALIDAPYLSRLDFSGVQISETCFEALQFHRRLQVLVMSRCRGVTDAGMSRLQNLSSLRALQLCSTEITDAAFEGLAGLPLLRSLHFAECPQLSSQAVSRFIAATASEQLRKDSNHSSRVMLSFLGMWQIPE